MCDVLCAIGFAPSGESLGVLLSTCEFEDFLRILSFSRWANSKNQWIQQKHDEMKRLSNLRFIELIKTIHRPALDIPKHSPNHEERQWLPCEHCLRSRQCAMALSAEWVFPEKPLRSSRANIEGLRNNRRLGPWNQQKGSQFSGWNWRFGQAR